MDKLMLKRDIPNQNGFEFVGVDAYGNEHDCVVGIDPIGCYSVYRVDNREPFFMSIVAWKNERSSTDHSKHNND